MWVAGHRGIVGNELADEAAGRACASIQSGVECLSSCVKSCMKNVLRKSVWKHERSGVVYGDGLKMKEESDWERSDVVCMARLRSGHCLELGEYRLRVGLPESGLCRICGEGVDSVAHV